MEELKKSNKSNMPDYKLKTNRDYVNFTQEKIYKLSTKFVKENGTEMRYLVLHNDLKKPVLFYPKEFYDLFTLNK